MMRPLGEVQAEILDRVERLDALEVDFADAVGGVLAADVEAPDDLPGFENAAMDGFAVSAADIGDPPVRLSIVDDVAAGSMPSVAVTRGTAARIMTGAPIPSGADAVVPVEATERIADAQVEINVRPASGDHIRPADGSMQAGTRVFDAGLRMNAAHVAVLASMGVHPRIHRRPVVAMMSTGDELVPPSTDVLAPGAIRDSNRTLMAGLLADLGVEVRDYGIMTDEPEVFAATLDDVAHEADVIVTSGGVSMGAYDVVKLALRDRGTVAFWKIAMKPGKPLGFGSVGDALFFGLPGNPVSVFVSFEQFMRPALLAAMGAARLFRSRLTAILDDGADTSPDKTVFLRVAVRREHDGRWHARKSGGQSSNVLSALASADALAVVPAGIGRIAPGGSVELEMIHWPEARTREEVLGGR